MPKIHIPGVSISSPAVTPSDFAAIVYDGLTIPSDSILFYESGQHTGLDGATDLTDINLNLVSLSRVGFKLRNTSDNSEGIVTFNSPNSIQAGMLGGTENLWDTGDFYEVVINIDNPDTIQYETTSNLGGTVSVDASGVPSITGSSGTHTFNFKITDDTDQSVSAEVTATVQVV